MVHSADRAWHDNGMLGRTL